MANLKNIIYLSNEDYETLVSTGTVTIDGDTLTYDENNVYVTPDKLVTTTEDGLMSCTDKVILDTINSAYIKSVSVSGNTLTITTQSGSAITFTPTFTEQHVGDVVTVTATSGSGIEISGTTANPTVGIDSSHKLPTTTEWSALPTSDTTYTFAEGTTDKAFTVTPSGGTAQTVTIHGLGDASLKGVATSVTSGGSDLVTSGAVYTAIDNLPKPMIYKGTLGTGGTITDLPTASSSNEGFTYKVITDGTYASQSAKVGDVFISNGTAWTLVPAGDDVEDTWRQINVNGTQLLGTGISTGAVNFKNGSNITITGSGNDITIASTDTNYYPTTFTWTDGTTAGPTGSLTGSGMTAVSFGAIPSASDSVSGIVTTDAQTFAGRKTFNTYPIMSGIFNSTKNDTVISFDYSSTYGAQIFTSGYFVAGGDDDDDNDLKPSDISGTDLDTYYFNTGITLYDANDDSIIATLQFPTSGGTLATTDYVQANPEIPSGTTTTALSSIKVGSSYYTIPTYSEATTSAAGLMSASDKTKLDGIATGAQVNVIETVKVNGVALTVTSKAVDVTVPQIIDLRSIS